MDTSTDSARPRLALFRHWLKDPRRTAAVAPSSAGLGAAMAAELPEDAHRVI